jgi:phosphate transport system substrate-binding protein
MKKTYMLALLFSAILISVVVYWSLLIPKKPTIEIDGSSTVFPITQAIAEEFQEESPEIRINVGISGTGGGFKRFVNGEIDIVDASRPIKQSEEQKAAENGVKYLEFQIAIDGLAIVVNRENNWVNSMTLQELNMTWRQGSTVKYWSDIRPEWPHEKINLYGPGTDSGTFDYFTEIVIGEEGASRPDYTASEDDNILVQGVAGDPYSLGYFGYAYYKQNLDKLKIVPIDAGQGPIMPTDQTIIKGEYPLSRPLFIYVNKQSIKRPEVKAFLEFYMGNANRLVLQVGYTPLPDYVYQENLRLIKQES